MSPKPSRSRDPAPPAAPEPAPPEPAPTGVRRIVVWNVQRLFHPKGSPLSRALDATEAQGWTKAAYADKIARVASLLRHACDGAPPALLARRSSRM